MIREQCWNDAVKPLVSVLIITYNHEPFIAKAIEGVLDQIVSFRVEILIHDDASTDGTANIVREYQKKYPELIRAVIQTQNQHSQGGKPAGTLRKMAQAELIAFCEGDDYWINPLKLQKQYDFMVSHPECTICSGGYLRYYQAKDESLSHLKNPVKLEEHRGGYFFDLEGWRKYGLIKTVTVMYRNIFDNVDLPKYQYTRDTHIFYHLLKEGRGYYFREIFAVYRIHLA